MGSCAKAKDAQNVYNNKRTVAFMAVVFKQKLAFLA
jgi:hypothetical protein